MNETQSLPVGRCTQFHPENPNWVISLQPQRPINSFPLSALSPGPCGPAIQPLLRTDHTYIFHLTHPHTNSGVISNRKLIPAKAPFLHMADNKQNTNLLRGNRDGSKTLGSHLPKLSTPAQRSLPRHKVHRIFHMEQR